MNTIHSNSILLCVLLSAVACGGTTADPTPGETGTATLPSSLQSATGGSATVSISGLVHGTGATPLSGVDVCLQAGPDMALATSTCATSHDDGSWTLSGVPANTPVTLAFEKNGYAAFLRPIQTDTTDIVLPPDEEVLVPTSSLVAPVGADSGLIQVFANVSGGTQPTDLVVTAISLDRSGDWPSLVSPDGTLAGSHRPAGAFENVQAGLYMLTFRSTSVKCVATSGLYGFPVTSFGDTWSASIVVPVLDGYVTSPVGVDCAPL